MGERSGKLSFPLLWRALLGLALLAYALSGPGSVAPSGAPDEAADDDVGLRIRDVSPVRAAPGGVVVLRVEGASADGPALTATLDGEPVTVVHTNPSLVAIRLEDELERRRWKVRVVQGSERSKGRDVWVEERDLGTVVRNLLGGLGLLVLGLRNLARGLRGYAGRRLRALVASTTSGGMRPLVFGVALGAIAQSTVPAVGLLVGLAQAGLIALAPALTVLVGAQLGSSAMALLLPVGADREALLLVALGVAWIGMGADRRRVAQGEAILGLGLLLFGVALLRAGLTPLVSEPALIDQAQRITSGGVAGSAVAAALGGILGVVMQGPAPAFGVVMSAAESTGLLGLRQGLNVLAGIWLGAAAVTAVIAWPIGAGPRRIATGYAALALLGTVVASVGTGMWALLADAVVPGDPGQLAYEGDVLMPRVGEHLGVGFIVMQLAVTLATLPFVRRVATAVESRRRASPASSKDVGAAVVARLGAALEGYRHCLALLLDMARTVDRTDADACAQRLAQSRDDVQACLAELDGPSGASERVGLRGLSLSLALVAGSIASLKRAVERGVETTVELDEQSMEALAKMHGLVLGVLDALLTAIADGGEIDVDQARAREIRINHEEARARARITEGTAPADLPRALHVATLLSAYEVIANHLYQAQEALSDPLD